MMSAAFIDAFLFFAHRDRSNAALHRAPVRYSPLTVEIAVVFRTEAVNLRDWKPGDVEMFQDVLRQHDIPGS